ncbi:MAG: BMP family ABC transporter substrate-binding protein [Clostridia bacterium]|nr:BMP family ABC transporter substrate-binding protein [Clostridia bacterium]
MAKKILALVLAVLMTAVVFASCSGTNENQTTQAKPTGETAPATETKPAEGPNAVTLKNVKIGFIFLHDEQSTYDKNFIDAAKATQTALGLTDAQVLIKTGVPEGNECYEAAADLVDQGCNIVFADSFGHEDYMIKAAKEFPNVQFCHATGTKAHTENLSNFHNAFASIYEGRFLAGVAAGLKLNEMIEAGTIKAEEAKIGYVGAFPYAEVISGFTSFFLGARSICPSATMEVDFTNSWFDVDAEREMANKLMDRKCVLISQHADSMGAPGACELRGVPDVSYNGSTAATCPNTYIVSSKINWQPYFELIIKSVVEGKAIPADWSGTIATGSVQLTELGAKAPAGTQAKIDEIKAKLTSGSLKVFDTATFKVNGETLTTYKADVDTDPSYTPDTEAIADGYFHESEYRSAPYFDLTIDGITRLDKQ